MALGPMLRLLALPALLFSIADGTTPTIQPQSGADDRAVQLNALEKIARPVLEALSTCSLQSKMINQTRPGAPSIILCPSYRIASALGRLVAGIAPWLELGGDNTTAEGQLRTEFIMLTEKAFFSAFVNESCADFIKWDGCSANIVEASYIGHALLRMPTLVMKWPQEMKEAIAKNTQLTFKFHESTSNNWCNFPSILQAGLWYHNLTNETNYIYEAIKLQEEWYKGDGAYGDGIHFHFDQYNSYVMHPQLVDAVRVCKMKGDAMGAKYECLLKRMQRWAVVQERMIHPDGSYLIVGRSEHYRFGAFQALSQLALQNLLPSSLPRGQVRTALTAVIKRFLSNTDNFIDGWLSAGVNGHQPGMMNPYGDSGALYLVSLGLLQLGLPATDPFWTEPAVSCTQAQIWVEGKDIGLDEAYDGPVC
eukprot:scpid76600/ scgid32997/ 